MFNGTIQNCPVGWKGAYTGKDGNPSVVLEAVATWDTWIWHAYFGEPGSNNDINILDRSPMMSMLLHREFPQHSFSVSDTTFNILYFLVDGIYPDWPIFQVRLKKCHTFAVFITNSSNAVFIQKTISQPHDRKSKHFAKMHESIRKDVERAFGILQARFSIVASASRSMSVKKMANILHCCIIIHNMIVEDERETYKLMTVKRALSEFDSHDNQNKEIRRARFQRPFECPADYSESPFQTMCRRFKTLTQPASYFSLREKLINHVWEFIGHADDDSISNDSDSYDEALI